jgi:hypothetical protein
VKQLDANRSNRGSGHSVGTRRYERAEVIGTRSANFIRASGHENSAASTGRTHDRTRPRRTSSQIILANQGPSTHGPTSLDSLAAMLRCCLIPASWSSSSEHFPPRPGTGLSPKSFQGLARKLHHSALGFWRPNVFRAIAVVSSSAQQTLTRGRLDHRPGFGRISSGLAEPLFCFPRLCILVADLPTLAEAGFAKAGHAA